MKTLTFSRLAPAFVSTLVALGLAPVSSAAVDPSDLANRLERVSPSHPRLFFADSEIPRLHAKIQSDPLLKGAHDAVLARAEDMRDMDPLERRMEGRRISTTCACQQRVTFLAFAYRMTGDKTFLRSAERQMLTAAAFDDWNPRHFLDVAEITTGLATGYDWLYNDLSEESRRIIRAAIVEKGLRTSQRPAGWAVARNNWNQVCHGGLVLGALAVLEDEPELAEEVIARALRSVPRAMEEYAPDGAHPEGPGYWKYGTTFNLLLIDALESVLGSDFGLASLPGFMDTAEFYMHATGPTGLFYNYSDSNAYVGIAPAMHWFAAREHEPSLLWWERQGLEPFVAKGQERHLPMDRMLPYLLIWGEPMGDVPPPARLHWTGNGRTPVAMHRSDWTRNATFVGIKGGSPDTSHAHMDAGSFVLEMSGVRWGVDLGAQHYNSLESRGLDLWDRTQESERWTVFRLNNLSHNTLVVDGHLQRVRGNAPIIGFSSDADAPHTVVDLSSVYAGEVTRAHRGIRLMGMSVLVQDELKTLKRGAHVRWGMATHAAVTLSGPHTATLEQDGQTMTLRVLSPRDARLTVLDMERPPRDYDIENPNTRMVAFEVKTGLLKTKTLAVLLDPGNAPGRAPALVPLDEW